MGTFDNCTFQNGESGESLLRIDNTQTFTADNVNFPTNTWSGSSNVWKSVDAGEVTFTNSGGDFAGPAYENDSFNRIHWTGYGPDLEIMNVVYTNDLPYVCDQITASVTVYDNGNVDISPGIGYYVDFYYNPPTPPNPGEVGELWVHNTDGLAAGDFVVIDFDMINDVAESWNSYVQVDTDNEITELDENNNLWGSDAITWNPLPAISDLNIHEAGGDVYLNWTYPISVDLFNIYKSSDPYDFSGAVVDTSFLPTYTEPAGTKMFYQVTAVRNCVPTLILVNEGVRRRRRK